MCSIPSSNFTLIMFIYHFSSPGLKNSISYDNPSMPRTTVGQMVTVSTGLSSVGGGSSQTSQGSYRRAMENIITDYRYNLTFHLMSIILRYRLTSKWLETLGLKYIYLKSIRCITADKVYTVLKYNCLTNFCKIS